MRRSCLEFVVMTSARGWALSLLAGWRTFLWFVQSCKTFCAGSFLIFLTCASSRLTPCLISARMSTPWSGCRWRHADSDSIHGKAPLSNHRAISRRSKTCPTCVGILRSRLFPRLPMSSPSYSRWFCGKLIKILTETLSERRPRGNHRDWELSDDPDQKRHQSCHHWHI